MQVKKLATAGVLTAVGVSCSTFYIPIGVAKAFPIQHFINVIGGVILGPAYAVAVAFVTSFLRNLMGTGSLLAFPGSMCGALLAGLCYRYTKKLKASFLGEVIGTGVFGAILAYPIAALLMGSKGAVFAFVLPFMISSFVGACISMIVLMTMKKTGVLKNMLQEMDK